MCAGTAGPARVEMDEWGVTLTEILVAMTLVVIVVVGFSITDAGRVRMEKNLRDRAIPRIAQVKAALAVNQIAKQVTQADRIIILNSSTPGKMRLRQVTCPEPIQPTCFTSGANFAWKEYRLNGTNNNVEVLPVTGVGCGSPTVLAESVSSLTFEFVDVSACAFPSAPQDNNVVGYTLTWSEGPLQHQFVGEATSRLVACSNLSATFDVPTQTGDSGLGLAATGVSDPPAVVCP